MLYPMAALLIAAASALCVWLARRRPLRAAVALLAGFALLGTLPLLSGRAVRPVYDEGIGALLPVALVSILTLVVVRYGFPRLATRPARGLLLALAGFLALAHLVVALLLWRVADEGVQLASAPVALTQAEILALRDGPRGDRLFGVLTVARAGDPPPAGSLGRNELARYDCASSWGGGDVWFPTVLPLTLEDGARIEAEGPRSPRQAWNWPPGTLRLGQCALGDGDPVIVWADVAEAVDLSGGERRGALVATRLVAHGDLESFRRDYVPQALFTGRYLSWLALGAALLALLPLAAGLRQWRRTRVRPPASRGGSVPSM